MKKFESICYKRNFLKEVIARIDYANPIENLYNELPKEVNDFIKSKFPIIEPPHKLPFEIQGKLKKIEFYQFTFRGAKREKQLTITPDSFFVSYTQYDKFEELQNEFFSSSEMFFKNFPDIKGIRIGLRYINSINEIGENPFVWGKYIKNEILGLYNLKIPDAKPSRIFHQLDFAFNTFNLKMNFGTFNPDYPAPIRQRQFILDFDAFYKGLFEMNEVRDKLNVFHGKIQYLFERFITEKMRKALNE